MPHMLRKYWIPLTSGFFILLFAVTVFMYIRQGHHYPDLVMADDIEQLATVFTTINNDVGIINFEHQKNPIDFLNVVKFVGSEIGSMNVANPSGWQGPYMNDNPTMQEKLYQIVHTNDGYFITPGQGVKLNNGKVIGKDIKLDQNSDIPSLASNDNGLRYEDKALAARIPTRFDRGMKLKFFEPGKEQ